MDLEYSAVGFAAGVLMGLTGMGGGAIVTPVLLHVGIPPATAVGTDLAFGALTKVVGAAQHVQRRTVQFGVVLRLAAGSAPGALLAAAVLQLARARDVEAANLLIERGVGLILVLVAAVTLLNLLLPLRPKGDPAGEPGARQTPRSAVLIPAGFVVGFTVGVTSIGSGTLLMGLLLVLWPVPALTLVGTDLAHGVLLTAVAAGSHALMGDLDVTLLGSLLLGSLPGIVLGTRLAAWLPSRALKGAFALLLLAIGIRLV